MANKWEGGLSMLKHVFTKNQKGGIYMINKIKKTLFTGALITATIISFGKMTNAASVPTYTWSGYQYTGGSYYIPAKDKLNPSAIRVSYTGGTTDCFIDVFVEGRGANDTSYTDYTAPDPGTSWYRIEKGYSRLCHNFVYERCKATAKVRPRIAISQTGSYSGEWSPNT